MTSSTRARNNNSIVVAYKNGAPVKLSDIASAVDSAENVKQAAWIEHDPGGGVEHSAAARQQHHQRGRPSEGAFEATAILAAGVGESANIDRSHRNHPGFR